MSRREVMQALARRVREEVSLRETVERLCGPDWDQRRSSARDHWRCCPFHSESTPSFHVVERPNRADDFWKCFGSCDTGGDVISFVAAYAGISPGAAIRRLAAEHGLEELRPDPARAEAERQRRAEKLRQEKSEAEALTQAALRRWEEAEPDHPALWAYLEGRLGGYWPPLRHLLGDSIPALRLHPSLPYLRPNSKEVLHRGPAILVRLGRGKFVGVQRIWVDGPRRQRLSAALRGEKCAKRFLCPESFGQPAVLVDPDADRPRLVVGEGVESTLAGLALMAEAGEADQWGAEAAITGGALWGPGERVENAISRATGKPLPSRFPDLKSDRPGWLPPPAVKTVRVLAEASTRCPQSASRVVERTRRKLEARGVSVQVRLPKGGWDSGLDFADVTELSPHRADD